MRLLYYLCLNIKIDKDILTLLLYDMVLDEWQEKSHPWRPNDALPKTQTVIKTVISKLGLV